MGIREIRRICSQPPFVDVLIIGGGLASAIIALRLADERPDIAICILERNGPASSSHTWCLFESDVTPDQWSWLRPLFVQEWREYEVRFPKRRRILRNGYGCITSESLQKRLDIKLDPSMFVFRADVAEVGLTHATLTNGARHSARLVIDARGAHPSTSMQVAWQKFVGLEVELAQPHGYDRPVLMDARVEQIDGFRFIYVLPLSENRLLIEDTRYSMESHLDREAMESDLRGYAASQGLRIATVLRSEHGVLPVVLDGKAEALRQSHGDRACVGMRGGFFHPTTGYSLPQAVATAFWIAAAPQLETSVVGPALTNRWSAHWNRGSFYRTLNRMLFLAAEPHLRYRVLERFYGLSENLIKRFYAGQLRTSDKLRLILGRPPVPVHRAIRALPRKAAWRSRSG